MRVQDFAQGTATSAPKIAIKIARHTVNPLGRHPTHLKRRTLSFGIFTNAAFKVDLIDLGMRFSCGISHFIVMHF
jgi:hypothetical protein